MASIFLSIPVLDKPELRMFNSLYRSILSCREHSVRLFFNENDSLISRVRNVHISMFLDEFKEYDYFMSLDSDIEIINCYATNNIFNKLIAHNLDFVGAVYALKNPGEPKSSSMPMTGGVNIEFNSGLREMKWLSSGCWCLKRSVVQKMVDNYPELTYNGDDNMVGKKVYGLYKPDIFEFADGNGIFRKYLSEDWAFAHRWKGIGGKIYADTSIVLNHIGRYPYKLWNVEVCATKNESTGPNTKEQLPLPGFDL